MATSVSSGPTTLSGQLCDYCHQKPKFSNHSFCSKTCASQSVTLCNQCHKRPKFQNFDYCGKNCAALANPAAKSRNTVNSVPQYSGPSKQSNVNANVNPQKISIDPVQLAKLVAQHLPQAQATTLNPGAQYIGVPAVSTGQYIAPPNSHLVDRGLSAHTTSTASSPQYPIPTTDKSNFSSPMYLASSSASPTDNQSLQSNVQRVQVISTPCRIPGCGKPAYYDEKSGKAGDYCSLRHREEAVSKGYRSACIMCLILPQSDTDYFCSRACREESLNKNMMYTAVESAVAGDSQ